MTSRQFKKIKNQNPFDFPNSYYTYDEYNNVLINKQEEEIQIKLQSQLELELELQLKKEQETHQEDTNVLIPTHDTQTETKTNKETLISDAVKNEHNSKTEINSATTEYNAEIDNNIEIEFTKETKLQKTYVDNRYIPKENIMNYLKDKNFLKNEMVFMRITSGFCPAGVEYGRKFMKDNNLIKIKKQNNKQIDNKDEN